MSNRYYISSKDGLVPGELSLSFHILDTNTTGGEHQFPLDIILAFSPQVPWISPRCCKKWVSSTSCLLNVFFLSNCCTLSCRNQRPSPTCFKKKNQILEGVDRVISVDLQRPGQGHEACFFDNTVPLEAIVSTDHMVDYFVQHVNLQEPIVVVTPNNECVKKARNFQLRLQGEL